MAEIALPSNTSESQTVDIIVEKKKRTNWKENESEALIKVIGDINILASLDDKKTKKAKLYSNVAAILVSDYGITRTSTQVELHWKALRCKFNTNKLLEAKSGEAAIKWKLYWLMKNLIGSRPLAQSLDDGIESQVLDEDEIVGDSNDESQVQAPQTFSESEVQEAMSPASDSGHSSSSGGHIRSLGAQKSKIPVKRSRVAEQTAKSLETVMQKQQEFMEEQQMKYVDFLKEVRQQDNDIKERRLQEARDFEKKMTEWKMENFGF